MNSNYATNADSITPRDAALQALFESRREARQGQIDQFQSDVEQASADKPPPSDETLAKEEQKTLADIGWLENLDARNDIVSNIEEYLNDLTEQAKLLGIKRSPTSIVEEEREFCQHHNTNNYGKSPSDIVLIQTTTLARLSMVLITKGLMWAAAHLSQDGKSFPNFSSVIAYLRQSSHTTHIPNHLLLEWEKNIYLIDLFVVDESLYCDRQKATDMYDICIETYDWIKVLFKLYKGEPDKVLSIK
ncbi:unnamed protein product [Didymodactylos carnosus]|uniref:Uncharacterized protein n=1 Tax=Didymodactylos carnosus TaxID=1234261 RepID=A0A814E180_9BILA|nr:unnamed protein product [Didymodactylos carnosus]CAF1225961.1 unnamed protein product [Didymodactylos carnosus]CAF3735572.1 unnamed protein product [Didymodactylos carnosus]CAF4034047.1 unnamed protein product [Didymodactylos carnosus]